MAINPDQLAELEEERRFLLRSLADLEREYAAGDVDDVDYHELKDGYTVRAAATLRAIDDGKSALPSKPTANWGRRLIAIVVVLVSIALVWWALVATSAERSAGSQMTGLDPRDQQQVLMAQARVVLGQSPSDAMILYSQVLDLDPDNTEALTYFGWTLALDANQRRDQLESSEVDTRLSQAVEVLTQATAIDPTYADPHCFLGIIENNFRDDPEAARPWVDACLASNPPADVRGLVETLSASIDNA